MHLVLCLHLIEPMRRLEIGDGASNLPERPGEPDCVYYLRNGSCGYGDKCRYNHPRGSNLSVRKCIFIFLTSMISLIKQILFKLTKLKLYDWHSGFIRKLIFLIMREHI
jgi:Zinc finger C-x8-C-x5-C-x3-H type (and similar)